MTSLLAALAFANARSVEQNRKRAERHQAAVGRRSETLRRMNAERAARTFRRHCKLMGTLLAREQPTTQRVADYLVVSPQAARDLLARMEAEGRVTREMEGRAYIWKAT